MVGKFVCARARASSAVLVSAMFVMTCMVSGALAAGRPGEKFGLPAEEGQPIEATPGSIMFGDVPVGETYTQTVRLSNVGRETLNIIGIAVSSAELGISHVTVPMVLEAGSSSTFTVAYKPKSAGKGAGHIFVRTSAGATPMSLDVKTSAISHESELTAS